MFNLECTMTIFSYQCFKIFRFTCDEAGLHSWYSLKVYVRCSGTRTEFTRESAWRTSLNSTLDPGQTSANGGAIQLHPPEKKGKTYEFTTVFHHVPLLQWKSWVFPPKFWDLPEGVIIKSKCGCHVQDGNLSL